MNLDKASPYLWRGFTRLVLELLPGRSPLKTGRSEWLLLIHLWILRHEPRRLGSVEIPDLVHEPMGQDQNPSSHSCEVNLGRGDIRLEQMHTTR